jgi:hypothetical protein
MNEELQSTNEELQTINDELRLRTTELNQANAFLNSILGSLKAGGPMKLYKIGQPWQNEHFYCQ